MIEPANQLRVFESLDDLFDNTEDKQILEWVNELAGLKTARRVYHRKRNARLKAFEKLAKQFLDRDEVERVEEAVEEEMEGGAAG